MARKKNTDQLTELEMELMKVLWETGPATVQTVREKLRGRRELAYTTVQTMLNILHRKGKVRRTLKDRAYCYRPAVGRQKAMAQVLGDLIERVFGGSAESLVLGLVETRHLSREKLAELNRLVKSGQGEGDGNG